LLHTTVDTEATAMINHGTTPSRQDETLQSESHPDHAASSQERRDDGNLRQGQPEAVKGRLPGQRGRQKQPTKVMVTMRFSRAVLDHFKAAGEGWQTRMNDALLEFVEQCRKKS
jgi:uncharacterized protein (DUF4415 family)